MTPDVREALVAADALLRRDDAAAARSMLEHLAEEPAAARTPEVQLLLAQACFQMQDGVAAERAVRNALASSPESAPAHALLGLVLADLDRLDESALHLARSLELRPGNVRNLTNLGAVQRRRGAIAEATRAFATAIAIDRDSAPAWRGLAQTHEAAGMEDAALAAWRTWQRLQPEPAAARAAIGAALARMHRWDDAEAELAAIPDAEDADGSAAVRLAFIRGERGDVDGARAACERAARRAPAALTPRFGQALMLPQIYDGSADLAAWRDRFSAGLDALEAESSRWNALPADAFWLLDWSNFYLAYQGGNDLALQQRYASLVSALANSAAPRFGAKPHAGSRSRGRLRVGFASSFFRRCTVGAYFESWISGLDRSRFETFLFHFGNEVDQTTVALRASVDHAVHPEGRVDRVAAKIRDAQVDILIYPQLGMDGRDATLASLRLAPVQCVAWGHPVTTGSNAIDYYFSCAGMEAPGAAQHYSERLLLLPGLGTRYAVPGCRRATRAEFGLPDAARLYACPQSLFKIHPDNDAMFAELLLADPAARLVFCAQPGEPSTAKFMARLRTALEARGVDVRRVDWQPLRPDPEFRALLSVCDVMLDTLHWSGGNTSLDALAAGLPIVTCPGPFLRGRQSAAMLRTLGLERLIANTPAQAVALAIDVARNSAATIRRTIAERSGALFGRDEPLSALETHLLQIAQRSD